MVKATKGKAATAAKGGTAKQGQNAKQGAAVTAIKRPAIPAGWVGNATGQTPKKAGITTATGYPQGGDVCKLLTPTGTLGTDQQAHYNAISKALGKAKTMPCSALLKAGATRRNVRRAVRAGVLVWQPSK